MKRFLFSLLVLFSFAAKSQDVFTLKLSAGANGCQIHGDGYSGFDKFGLFFGMDVNARAGDKGSWELGFYFSQKGSKKNQDPKNNDYTFYRIHLNYLDLGINYRRVLGEKYFFTLGPSVSYLISYKETSDAGNWTGQYYYNKFALNINAGIGGRINDKLTIELRTNNSITPIREWGGNFTTNNLVYPNPIARAFNKGMYSNVLTLLLSYKLDLKKHDGN